MAIICAKECVSPPPFLVRKLSPYDAIPEDSLIRDYGVDTLKAGQASDLHYHDCDEWWIIVAGHAQVFCAGNQQDVGAGDMVFTKMGENHRISAITEVTLVWLEGPLQGRKRVGHLHEAAF